MSTNASRTVLAVFLGYLSFLLLEVIGAFAAAAVFHERTGSSTLISGELITFVAGALAGALTARVARARPLAHAGALGLTLVSATVIVTAATPHRAPIPYPGWFPYASALLSGVGAFVGGALVSGSKTEAE